MATGMGGVQLLTHFALVRKESSNLAGTKLHLVLVTRGRSLFPSSTSWDCL